jgi:hypothetical protein
LIFVGVAALLGTVGGVAVNPAVVASIALMMVGAALVAGAWFGRGRGLIALGLLLTVIAGSLATIGVPLHGPIGQRIWHPLAEAGVQPKYEMAIGHLRVDLSDVPWSARRHDVQVRLGIGNATVYVPNDVGLVVDAHAGAGKVVVAGRESDGVNANLHVALPGPAGAAVLHIDARIGAGQIQVLRATPGPGGP